MGEIIISIMGGSVGAALVAGVFGIITWKLNRKAAKEDKADTIVAKLDDINTKLDNHIKSDEARNASACRNRILLFCDECVQGGIHHGHEHWDEILEDINEYEAYCDSHKDYPNAKAVKSIAHIKKLYAERLEKNDF